jgi:hypothetical protein
MAIYSTLVLLYISTVRSLSSSMVLFKIHYGFLYEPIMCIIVFETRTRVPTNDD